MDPATYIASMPRTLKAYEKRVFSAVTARKAPFFNDIKQMLNRIKHLEARSTHYLPLLIELRNLRRWKRRIERAR